MTDIMAASDFRAAVTGAFDRELLPRGFQNVKDRKWVSSDRPEVRKVLVLGYLNQYIVTPAWGFSFDFVPHLGAGDEVKWHRTVPSARLDLSWDPLDYTADVSQWKISRFDGDAGVRSRLVEFPRRVVGEAVGFWNRIERLDDVPAVFEEWRNRRSIRFGFENYVRASLVYAFVLARLGRLSEAKIWLNRFLETDIRPEAKPILRRRLEAAHDASRP